MLARSAAAAEPRSVIAAAATVFEELRPSRDTMKRCERRMRRWVNRENVLGRSQQVLDDGCGGEGDDGDGLVIECCGGG